MVSLQKSGSGEMRRNNSNGTSEGSESSKGKPADAYVYCTTDASALEAARHGGDHAGDCPSPTASSIALDGPSMELDESSRVARFGPSTSLQDIGSQSAMTSTLGITARERLYMLAGGTYRSPRRGVSDAPLPDDAWQASGSQRLSRAASQNLGSGSAQALARSASQGIVAATSAQSLARAPAPLVPPAPPLVPGGQWGAAWVPARPPLSDVISTGTPGNVSAPTSQAEGLVGRAAALCPSDATVSPPSSLSTPGADV